MGGGIPITYVPARNTIFLSFALAWAETLGASDIFVGVNALDYSGYPDCRPEYIEAYERMANLATKAGVEGTQQLTHPRAADAAHEGGHHPPRARARRRLRRHAVAATTPTPQGRACGQLRRLPLAAARLRGRRRARPGAVRARRRGRAVTYAVKEIFYTLQGEGANAGRPAVFCRFAGCNLWTGREQDRHARGVHVLRHRLRRHRRHARRQVPHRRRARGRGRRASGRPSTAAAARSSSAPAASRSCSSTRRSSTRSTPPASRSPSRPTARSSHHPGSTGSASAPRPAPTPSLLQRQRTQARLPAAARAARALRRTPTSSTSSSSPWTAPTSTRTSPPPIAYCLAHPQWRLSLQTHKITGIR